MSSYVANYYVAYYKHSLILWFGYFCPGLYFGIGSYFHAYFTIFKHIIIWLNASCSFGSVTEAPRIFHNSFMYRTLFHLDSCTHILYPMTDVYAEILRNNGDYTEESAAVINLSLFYCMKFIAATYGLNHLLLLFVSVACIQLSSCFCELQPAEWGGFLPPRIDQVMLTFTGVHYYK